MSNLTTKIWTFEDTYDVSIEFARIEDIITYCLNATINKEFTQTNTVQSGIFLGNINGISGYYAGTNIDIGKNLTIISVSASGSAKEYNYSYDEKTGLILLEAITQMKKVFVVFTINYKNKLNGKTIKKEWKYNTIPYQSDILNYIDDINLILKHFNQEEHKFTQADYFNLTLANELEQGLAKCLNLLNNE
jgi:hypothetical protein